MLAIAATVLEGTELLGTMLEDFKLSSPGYQALSALPYAPDSVQCLWFPSSMGTPMCQANPTIVTVKGFPEPVLPIER